MVVVNSTFDKKCSQSIFYDFYLWDDIIKINQTVKNRAYKVFCSSGLQTFVFK